MSSLRVRPYCPPSSRQAAPARSGLAAGSRRARQGYALALITAAVALLGGLLPALTGISRDAWGQALGSGPVELNTLVMAVAGPAALLFTAWLLVAMLASLMTVLITAAGPRAPIGNRVPEAGDRTGQPARRAGLGGERATRVAGLIAPALLRHGIAALLGVTLLAAPAAAATGTAGGPGSPGSAGRTGDTISAGRSISGSRLASTGEVSSAAPASAGSARPSAAWPDPWFTPPADAGNVPGYVYESLSGPAPIKGWTPAVPTAAATPAPARPDIGLVASSGQHRRLDDDGLMVVHRGDSLWSIASRSLGPGANEAEIAAEWPRWFIENKDVIGPDPDRIVPGQRLRPPPAPRRSASARSNIARGGGK